MDLNTFILDYSVQHSNFSVQDLRKASEGRCSRVYISRKVNQLAKEGKLVRSGSTRSARYANKEKWASLGTYLKKRFKNEDIEEYCIYQGFEKDLPFIGKLPEHIQSILVYAFSEMLNNAIEHSRSHYIDVELGKKDGVIFFVIRDYGVGVFRNVRQKRKLSSEIEAMQDLLKGKTTTAPRAHSGEGIFFTSKAGDFFSLDSFGYVLTIDNKTNDIFMGESGRKKKGTEVTFSVEEKYIQHLDEVFREYYTDPEDFAFDKTKILVKLYTRGTVYVSRSQARRLLQGLEKFKTIILDFDQVPAVGQAFCDEIFRVFRNSYPEIDIQTIHTNETVRFMVERSKNTDQSRMGQR